LAPGGIATRGTTTPDDPVASYALVRFAAATLPEPTPPSEDFRAAARRLLRLTRATAALRGPLVDVLHDAIASATPTDRRTLLALRRDVHNGRSLRPELRERVGDWPRRLPALHRWLDLTAEIDQASTELDRLSGAALRADRRGLAELCRSEELRRAVALTSTDLLRAVDRAAACGAAVDSRARKSEPSVLRYALRAATRTTPLSWFSLVGWGWWEESGRTPRSPLAGQDPPPVATAGVNRALLTALVQRVQLLPELRQRLPHLLAPGLWVDNGVLHLRRVTDDADSRTRREEQVSLPLTGPLRYLLASVPAGEVVRPDLLAERIAARLPGPTEQALPAARKYLDNLIDQGVLQAAYPVDPQALEAAETVAAWLAGLDLTGPAATLREIAGITGTFAHLPAEDRPRALTELRDRWAEAFAAIGARPPESPQPVTEDVVRPDPLSLGPEQGSTVMPTLSALAPLYEIFDPLTVARRLLRDRFVARFGPGARCSVVELAQEYAAVWKMMGSYRPGGMVEPGAGPVSTEIAELLALRRDLIDAMTHTGAEVTIPESVVDAAAARLPRWISARPISHSVFGQPYLTPEGRHGFCVNHVYGGWGRFTSRFLHHLDPALRRAVTAQIRRTLGGDGTRIAQLRPVGGFNANLHPLLVDDEIVDERSRGSLVPADLEVVHDTRNDQLRLRVVATGELLDVLYLGFLIPTALPDRLVGMLLDLGPGLMDLSREVLQTRVSATPYGKVAYRPRLRYGDVVLSRTRWRMPSEAAARLRAALDGERSEVPVRAVIRWRDLLDLPEQIFVSGSDDQPTRDAGNLSDTAPVMSYLRQPRSQYIDLGSALHLRCLSRTLARYPEAVVLEEALPRPRPGERVVEVVAEVYRRAR
jgi:hypothetical protein